MLKKIMLTFLICILIVITYITILWVMSMDSIMDKDGMVYKDYNNSNENNVLK